VEGGFRYPKHAQAHTHTHEANQIVELENGFVKRQLPRKSQGFPRLL